MSDFERVPVINNYGEGNDCFMKGRQKCFT